MSFKIYYKHHLQDKKSLPKRQELSLLKINSSNFKKYRNIISECIDKFNFEISWDEMWDIDEADFRLSNKEILFILLENNNPIGHVWYDYQYLYNAFVSKEREDGDSIWFIQETMWEMKDTHNLNYIQLDVDSWNERAIKFWEKLGYEKLI